MALATPTQTVLHPRLVCTVRGIPTPVFSFDAQHNVNQPIGTASVTLPLPLPAHLYGADGNVLNQPIEIQAGHDETAIRTVFSGRIDADRMVIDERERTATLQARGWATLLDWPEETDLEFAGPIPLTEIIRSLCRWRGVRSFRIDPMTHPLGPNVIQLGGNKNIDDGKVIIPRRTSPLTWIDRMCRHFGFRIFDTPSGEVRVQRISGTPTGAPVATYAEGVNAFSMERTRDLKPMVTYWVVEGATYTDDDGVSIPIRSLPASVPYDPLLNPPGYRADRISENAIHSFGNAEAVRMVAETDHGAPYRELRWEAVGDAWRQPGDIVRVESESFGESGNHWLMGVRSRLESPGGYVTNFDAWSGGGQPLSSVSDLIRIPIGAGPWHVGDEYLSHYAKPSPNGTTITLPFTVPDEFVSLAVTGRGHGVNSFLIDGANTDSTVSKVEVWQNGESVGSAEMPVMPENLLLRLDYRQDRHWEAFRMPVPGRLEPGQAELRFVSGEDSRGGTDDFEIKDVVLELRGAGQTTLPRPRGF